MRDLKILSIEEYLDEDIIETEVNEHGVFPPRYSVVIVDDNKLKLHVYVANNGEGYLYGLSFEYSTGGGGGYPSKIDKPESDKRKGLLDYLSRLEGYSMYKMYRPYIERAKKKLMYKQLTIFDL